MAECKPFYGMGYDVCVSGELMPILAYDGTSFFSLGKPPGYTQIFIIFYSDQSNNIQTLTHTHTMPILSKEQKKKPRTEFIIYVQCIHFKSHLSPSISHPTWLLSYSQFFISFFFLSSSSFDCSVAFNFYFFVQHKQAAWAKISRP